MALTTHPLLTSSFAGVYNLPTQALSIKIKTKDKKKNGYSDWEKQNLDGLEFIAWSQYSNNHRYLVNEKIVNGEFIASDYYECDDEEEYLDPLEQLIKDGKIPKFVKNYNIASKIINIMVSIFEEFPDTFSIVGHGETFQSERGSKQAELLKQWFDAKIEEKINQLIEEPQDDSPEAQQKYQEEREQAKQYLTPEDIGEYMKNFRHDYELWAEYKELDYRFKYNLPKLRKQEYRDFIINGIRARHFRVTPYGLLQETIDPKNLFYDKSPGVEYIQDGDYAGIIYKASAQRVIDMFGKLMSAEQIEKINQVYTEFNEEPKGETVKSALFGETINYRPINGVPYNTNKFYNNEHLNTLAPGLGMNYSNVDPFDLTAISSLSIFSKDFIITEGYWKSQDPVWTINWINPETQLQEIIDVDEEFIFPSYIKKVNNQSPLSEIKFNTAVKSYDTVIYGGIKIRLPNSEFIYLNTGIKDYQKTSPNTIIPKLPIFGQITNNRGVVSRGLVDHLKPFIFLVNVAMNKAAKFQERGYLPFIAMDMKILPRHKDWGEGDAALAKWLGIGEDLGAAPVDTSSTNTMGDPTYGGQFPRIVDIDLTPRTIQQLQIARDITTVAYESIGISPQLLGSITASDTATGINVGLNQSQNAISHWVSTFYECEREMIQYSLEIAQWLEANNKDVSVEYVNSDYTTGLLKFANKNFNLFDWRIYITNSQDELRRKKIYNDLALNMNTLPVSTSDRLEMTNKLTPSEKIVKIIRASEEKAAQQQQKQFELQQQQLIAQTQAEKDKLAHEEKLLTLKLASEEEQAWIKSRGYISAGEQDLDANKIPDAFEYERFQVESDREAAKLGLTRDKVQLEKEKEEYRRSEAEQKLKLEEQKLLLKDKQINQSAKNVKIMDKGKYNK